METAELVARKDYAPRYRVREICLLALHRLRDPNLRPDLERLMDRAEFYGVRRLAAHALEDLGDARSIPSLEHWLRDADMEIAFAAKAALTAISNQFKTGDAP